MNQWALFITLLALIVAASARRWSSNINVSSDELTCGQQRLKDVLNAKNEAVTVCNSRMTKCFAGCAADTSIRAGRNQQQKYICKENKGTGRWTARRGKRVAYCPRVEQPSPPPAPPPRPALSFDSAWLTAYPVSQPLVINITGDLLTYTADTYSASASFSDSINGTIVTPEGTLEVQGTFTDTFFLAFHGEMAHIAVSNISTSSLSAITEGETFGYFGSPGTASFLRYQISNVTGSSFMIHFQTMGRVTFSMTDCTETGSTQDRSIACTVVIDSTAYTVSIAVGASGIAVSIGHLYLFIVQPNTLQAAKLDFWLA